MYVMTVLNAKTGKESKSRPFFVKEGGASGATGPTSGGSATGPTGPTGGRG